MKEYFRGCCSFSVFVDAVIGAAIKHKYPVILIDRLQARRHWRKGMTGYEAFITQRNEFMRTELYSCKKWGKE